MSDVTKNDTVRSVAAGVVAAIAVLVIGYGAGQGLNAAEILLAISAFLTVTFGLQQVSTRRELRRLTDAHDTDFRTGALVHKSSVDNT